MVVWVKTPKTKTEETKRHISQKKCPKGWLQGIEPWFMVPQTIVLPLNDSHPFIRFFEMQTHSERVFRGCPRQESNLHQGLRRPLLYPLSYEDSQNSSLTVVGVVGIGPTTVGLRGHCSTNWAIHPKTNHANESASEMYQKTEKSSIFVSEVGSACMSPSIFFPLPFWPVGWFRFQNLITRMRKKWRGLIIAPETVSDKVLTRVVINLLSK